MSWEPSLIAEYRRLEKLSNPQKRGLAFQDLIGALFEQAHFKVWRNPAAARPRQTDLLAVLGRDSYLIETKWQRRRSHSGDVDDLFVRLDRLDPSVVGVLVSVAGFARTAIDQVETRRDRRILLMGGSELEDLFGGYADLTEILRDKDQHLRVSGRVLLEADGHEPLLQIPHRRLLPSAQSTFFMKDGQKTPWWASGGSFGRYVFVQDLPDIDWTTSLGRGVVLDLPVVAKDETDLLATTDLLLREGWSGESPRWTIQQSETNWHGLTSSSFRDAILHWGERYREAKTLHHTEEVTYADSTEGGFFTLTADIEAGEGRRVRHAALSFQFIGIPLNLDPLRHLAERISRGRSLYFRPLDEPSLHQCFFPRDERIPLGVLGNVIEDHGPDFIREQSRWIIGLVARNPFTHDDPPAPLDDSEPWPDMIRRSDTLVCELRHQHLIGEVQPSYSLRGAEWTWTADALIFRPFAEVDDEG